MATPAMRPYFRVDYTRDRKLAAVQPHDVIVRQREYNHDVVVLHYRDSGISRRKYRAGQPVVVRWGWAPSSLETFYGYVHSSKRVQKPGVPAYLEVYVVGASWRTNRPRMRTFKNLNVVPFIARIAREHKLTLANDPSSRFHRAIPQLGRSDWRLMCDLARDIGFTLSCKRTQVQFKRRLIDTRPQGRQPTFTWRGGFGPVRGTLYQFVHKAGSAPLAQNRRLVIGGVDDSGKPFWATDPEASCCEDGDAPQFTEYWMDDAPASIHEGRELLSGLSRMNRFYVIANVVVSGAVGVRCGMTVRFTGAGLGAEVAGYWWVGAVDHRLSGPVAGRPSKYTMHMDVGRESVLQTVCVTEEPPTSWQDKPVVYDPCEEPLGAPEVPTVFAPQDDCPPLEQPPKPPCHCPPKKCPGSHKPLPTTRRLTPPRLDRWGARVVPVKRPVLTGSGKRR